MSYQRERDQPLFGDHPWSVVVYVEGSQVPIRVFDRYLTERDAQGFADVLIAHGKRNGWTQRIRVERRVHV